MKYESRDANKHEIDIIKSSSWIEQKVMKLLCKTNQKYLRKKLYKVVKADETVVFIEKDNGYLVLNNSSKEHVIHLQNKYLKWSGDHIPLFKEHFGYLFNEYGFEFKMDKFKSAFTKEGKFFYHGPVHAYSLYNDKMCITFVYLMQRQEWDVYLNDVYTKSQTKIRSGKYLNEGFGNLKTINNSVSSKYKKYGYIYAIAFYIRKEVDTYNELYGVKLTPKV